jgi:2-methylcitrate dehydratase
MAKMTIAEQLADYGTSLRFEEIPAAVVHRTKALILDTFGCALGGHDGETVKIARQFSTEVSSTRPATVLGTGEQTSLDLAVFVNGSMIRYLDFNDGYTSTTSGHPSDSIAALLSAAEVAHASGRDFITATVAAYEVFCRMCDTGNIKQYGFDHVIPGAMASTIGAARLLGLTAEQTVEALNIVLSANIGLYQVRIGNVPLWKGSAYANASRNAVFAVQLAQRGMTGPSPIFEGRGGYFLAVSRKPFELPPFGGRGGDFKIMDILMKRFALGQYSQSVADAAIQAHDRISSVDDIERVHVRTLNTAIYVMAGDPEKWRPANRESADHSMPYIAGIALTHGAITPEHFEEPYLHDAKLLELVSRIECSVSEEANSREPEAMLCDLDVLLKDGRTESIRVEYHRGHFRNPMSDEEVNAKYHGLADPVLPVGRSKVLRERLWNLEDVADIGDLFALARF